MKLSMHASFFGADNNRHFLENPILYKELINDKKKLINLRHYLYNNIYDLLHKYQHFYTIFDYVRKTINYSTNK